METRPNGGLPRPPIHGRAYGRGYGTGLGPGYPPLRTYAAGVGYGAGRGYPATRGFAAGRPYATGRGYAATLGSAAGRGYTTGLGRGLGTGRGQAAGRNHGTGNGYAAGSTHPTGREHGVAVGQSSTPKPGAGGLQPSDRRQGLGRGNPTGKSYAQDHTSDQASSHGHTHDQLSVIDSSSSSGQIPEYRPPHAQPPAQSSHEAYEAEMQAKIAKTKKKRLEAELLKERHDLYNTYQEQWKGEYDKRKEEMDARQNQTTAIRELQQEELRAGQDERREQSNPSAFHLAQERIAADEARKQQAEAMKRRQYERNPRLYARELEKMFKEERKRKKIDEVKEKELETHGWRYPALLRKRVREQAEKENRSAQHAAHHVPLPLASQYPATQQYHAGSATNTGATQASTPEPALGYHYAYAPPRAQALQQANAARVSYHMPPVPGPSLNTTFSTQPPQPSRPPQSTHSSQSSSPPQVRYWNEAAPGAAVYTHHSYNAHRHASDEDDWEDEDESDGDGHGSYVHEYEDEDEDEDGREPDTPSMFRLAEQLV